MIRMRHYHLGCGESLKTHYNLLWTQDSTRQKQKKKTAKPDETGKDKKLTVKI